MNIIKILLITLLAAVALGAIIGVVLGKHSVKKAIEGSKSLLSVKERIIYGCMVAAGIACIMIGVFVVGGNNSEEAMAMDGDFMSDEFAGQEFDAIDGEGFDEDSEGFNVDDDDSADFDEAIDNTEAAAEPSVDSDDVQDEIQTSTSTSGGSTMIQSADGSTVVIVG